MQGFVLWEALDRLWKNGQSKVFSMSELTKVSCCMMCLMLLLVSFFDRKMKLSFSVLMLFLFVNRICHLGEEIQ